MWRFNGIHLDETSVHLSLLQQSQQTRFCNHLKQMEPQTQYMLQACTLYFEQKVKFTIKIYTRNRVQY